MRCFIVLVVCPVFLSSFLVFPKVGNLKSGQFKLSPLRSSSTSPSLDAILPMIENNVMLLNVRNYYDNIFSAFDTKFGALETKLDTYSALMNRAVRFGVFAVGIATIFAALPTLLEWSSFRWKRVLIS